MHVGERIKHRRKELGYNADYLADKLGVSRSTIFRYEKGDIEKLPTEILEKVALVLDTTPAYLMGWSEESSEKLLDIYNKLTENNRKEVLGFAQYKLNEQNKKIISLRENEESHIHTLAAHSEDPTRKYSEEDIDKINSFLDELDKEHDKKHKK